MATVTVTLTYGTAVSQAGTPAFWTPQLTVAPGVGGAINAPNVTATVQFADSTAQTNIVKIVGTYEQIANWAREILKAVGQG